MKRYKILLYSSFLLLCLNMSGCTGFINGYMADRPSKSIENQNCRHDLFPAVNADFDLMRQNNDRLNNAEINSIGKAATKTFMFTYLTLDVPISAAVDAVFMPFVGLHYLFFHDANRECAEQANSQISNHILQVDADKALSK